MTSTPRILFVDDEAPILSAVKRLFRRDAYEIETASDGRSGLEVFRRFRPSVVISDHRMPGMSGVEFLLKVREIDPDAVRVMLTGCTDLPAAEAAINEGEVWRFLTKPWNDEDLRATVAAACERHRLIGENRALANKLSSIGLLAGGVAHELNNPIGGILAFAQMLRKDFPADSSVATDLRQIEDAALRCKRIIGDLLDFARTSRAAAHSVIQVEEAAEKAILLARFQVKGDIEIERDFGVNLAGVFADRNRLEQVFLNLLSNAVHALDTTRKPGHIMVRTFEKNGQVCLSVADDGPGIPEADQARVFDAFFTTKPVGVGTGLGLTICQSIVRDHGGHIELASAATGGTTFTVSLPALVASTTTRIAAGGAT